jgi:hypothetical protein
MSEDPRCCGTGTCIINAAGMCWCGQQWDGEKMCFTKHEATAEVRASMKHTELAKASTAVSCMDANNG